MPPAALLIDPEVDQLLVGPFAAEDLLPAMERSLAATKQPPADVLAVGRYELDRRTLELRGDEACAKLTPTEFRVRILGISPE